MSVTNNFKYFWLITFFSTALFCQVEWFGYFESEGDYLKLPQNEIYFGYHKIRLDFDASPSDNIRIGADVVYKFYNGETTYNFMDFIDPILWPDVPVADSTDSTETLSYLPISFSDTLIIDNAFLEFYHEYFDLTLGRQQISPGVGYAWNPSDIFNHKDTMDPTYEQTGVSAIRLELPLIFDFTLSGIVQPGKNIDLTKQYWQFKTYLGRFDVAALYGKTIFSGNSITSAGTVTRDLFGINLEGEFAGIGVRTELAVNRIDNIRDSLQYEYIIGGDYTFENSLYILGEYLHNDFGTPENETGFTNYVSYYEGICRSINQNYLFGMGMYPLTDLIDISVFSIMNLDDRSVIVNPQLVWRIYQNVEISGMINLFIGSKDTEFGNQEFGARLRIRAYF